MSDRQEQRLAQEDVRSLRERVNHIETTTARVDERTEVTQELVRDIRDELGGLADEETVVALEETQEQLKSDVGTVMDYGRLVKWGAGLLVGSGALGAFYSVAIGLPA